MTQAIDTPSPANQKPARRWWTYVVGLLLLVLAFGGLGYFVLPPVAKSLAVDKLSAILHRPLNVERIDFNPYTLELEIVGVSIQEKGGGETVAGFDRLYVNVADSSFWRGGPVVSELRLMAPALRIVRLPDGRLNFSDLIDEWLARPQNDDPTPAFALNNIQISDGHIDFEDRLLAEKHRISEINIGLPFVSSLPDATDIFVEPVFSARFDEAPVVAKGKSKLFASSLESELALDLNDVQIGRYLNYLPSRLPVVWRSGGLDIDLKLTFRRQNGNPDLSLAGKTALKEVAISETNAAPLLSFKRLAVDLAAADPLKQSFVIDRLSLESPVVQARASRQGTLNWLDLLQRPGAAVEAKADRPPAAAATVPRWSLGEVQISDGALHWLDESHAAAFKADVDALNLTLRNLASTASEAAEFSAECRLNAEPWLKLQNVAVKGGRLDLARQTVAIDEIAAKDAQSQLKRAANGTLNFVPLPALRSTGRPAASSARPAWKVNIGKLRAENLALRFDDATVSPAASQLI
ncbi:MAG TPA: DUF748 domain-containing protein, partial [Accumulibacter sp.]|nr:DUF748 domain-containing protein [Accumulibacter sp.]